MSIVRNFIEQGYDSRIQQMDPNTCSVQTAVEVMDQWRKLGAVTVFMAGTFDIPTPNHRLGLGEARLMAGALACGIDYSKLREDTPDDVMWQVQNAAASPRVKLMVTLDTDEAVRQSKAFRPEKGDCPKPIFGWNTRAYNLASYTAPRNDGTGQSMVDFITSHGPDACKACGDDCSSVDNALMVAALQPSLVVVNAQSTDTVKTVTEEMQSGKLPNTLIGFTNEQNHQFVDDLIGGRVSGTSIVRRARGLKPSAGL